jgi:demethylmenaquinone methyltransferase/2-methoxy-6-polyprenyl-1,4-benzoquinol methylase
MTHSDDYARRLLLSNLLREPAILAAIRALHLPPGSRGLDVGCGIGLHTPLLAQAVGHAGHVIGLDLSPDFMVLAKQRAEKSGLCAQINFQGGDMNHLPFADDTFDWVWSADTVHPGLNDDPLGPVKEFMRVVRPGGILALIYWSSQMLLPGYPLLEARLNTAFAETVPYMNAVHPEHHFLRALDWLRAAGFEELRAHTFVTDVHAPIRKDTRRALTMTFDMFWGELRSKLLLEDRAEFERLCLSESPDCIVDQQGYYAFLTYSLFRGQVVK